MFSCHVVSLILLLIGKRANAGRNELVVMPDDSLALDGSNSIGAYFCQWSNDPG